MFTSKERLFIRLFVAALQGLNANHALSASHDEGGFAELAINQAIEAQAQLLAHIERERDKDAERDPLSKRLRALKERTQ